MSGHSGVLTRLGQQPRDVEVRLPAGLIMHLPLHGGEARGIVHQTIEPTRLALGQEPARLVRNGHWRGHRRACGTTTLTPALNPTHLLVRLQKNFHERLLPSRCTVLLFLLHQPRYLSEDLTIRHRLLGSDPVTGTSTLSASTPTPISSTRRTSSAIPRWPGSPSPSASPNS